MKKLVIATQNRNKFTEMKEALKGIPWELVPAFDFPDAPEVEEDGKTLEDNSLKKARILSAFTGFPALADDTGLFVDALNGQPGIYAARFAGEKCTYEDNVRKMLELMRGVEKEKRGALFRTVITVFYPDKPLLQVSGEVSGEITVEARGGKGFGYDPIFQPSGYSKVFADMTAEEKNKISHRGLALIKAKSLLG